MPVLDALVEETSQDGLFRVTLPGIEGFAGAAYDQRLGVMVGEDVAVRAVPIIRDERDDFTVFLVVMAP